MSSRISSTMNLGQRAMANSQSALHTTAHNVANRQTEGFSRQRVEVMSAPSYGLGKNRIGNGARMVSVQRVNNPYMERQIGNEKSQLGFLQGQASGLMRLEQVYNEQATEGINSSMAQFFNSFRELSTAPESMAKRIAVKESGDLLAKDFARVNEQLVGIRGDANSQVALTVNEINSTTHEIASLNTQIQKVEVGGGFANDERDRRDLLLKKLGELTEIRWAEGEDSSLTISAANNAILVAGGDARRLEVVASPADGNKAEGDFDVVYYHHEHADPMVITDRIKGGRLGGVLAVRDGDVKEFKDKMDAMAFEISRNVNDIHEQGYNAFNRTGEAFFEPMNAVKDASANMKLRPQIAGDVGRIATGFEMNSPGDNRVANAIAEVQHSKEFFDGNTSLNDFYKGIVTELGLRTQNVNRSVETQEGVVKQLEGLRESYSGVSIDEEMANMIEWQKQFDASARIIKTADEMFDTVLNIKRY
jgi:flagellar hook-associated protein 1 FlgK